jgi:hypothetical protein
VLREADAQGFATALVDLEEVNTLGSIVVRIERAYDHSLKGKLRRTVEQVIRSWGFGVSLADVGATAVMATAESANVAGLEPTETAVSDLLADIAHFCDRCGLEPRAMFERGLRSYVGDFEDGPRAVHSLDGEVPLIAQAVRFARCGHEPKNAS